MNAFGRLDWLMQPMIGSVRESFAMIANFTLFSDQTTQGLFITCILFLPPDAMQWMHVWLIQPRADPSTFHRVMRRVLCICNINLANYCSAIRRRTLRGCTVVSVTSYGEPPPLETLQGSFSAVSKQASKQARSSSPSRRKETPNFARKYSLESSSPDLQDLHVFAPLGL